MTHAHDHDLAASPQTPPTRGIQAWADLQLGDGTQRQAAIPGSPSQASTGPADWALEPELEAEP